ncbi:MAG TPA: SIMPL domain-containing protein [Phycisphaerales bacterium]|nr:SIMPL domain-containing protein [Phycisphaerales bacterium]
MRITRLASAAVLGLSILAPVVTSPALAQPVAAERREPSTVGSSATARVYRAPDYLDLHLGVETFAASAQDAQAQCAQGMEKTLAALKEMGLDKYEPQTGTISLQPRYNDNYRDQSERRIVGYTAMNTVRVRTADLKASARIIDTALKAGANRVDGIVFGINEYLAAREEALAMAAKAARRKAEVLAGALDHRLGRIVSLTESSPAYYGSMNRMAQVQAANVGAEGAPGEESVVPGQIEVVVTVNVSFELEK